MRQAPAAMQPCQLSSRRQLQCQQQQQTPRSLSQPQLAGLQAAASQLASCRQCKPSSRRVACPAAAAGRRSQRSRTAAAAAAPRLLLARLAWMPTRGQQPCLAALQSRALAAGQAAWAPAQGPTRSCSLRAPGALALRGLSTSWRRMAASRQAAAAAAVAPGLCWAAPATTQQQQQRRAPQLLVAGPAGSRAAAAAAARACRAAVAAARSHATAALAASLAVTALRHRRQAAWRRLRAAAARDRTPATAAFAATRHPARSQSARMASHLRCVVRLQLCVQVQALCSPCSLWLQQQARTCIQAVRIAAARVRSLHKAPHPAALAAVACS